MRIITLLALTAGLAAATPALADWSCVANKGESPGPTASAQLVLSDSGVLMRGFMHWSPKLLTQDLSFTTIDYTLLDGKLDGATPTGIDVQADSYRIPILVQRVFAALQVDSAKAMTLQEWKNYAKDSSATSARMTDGGYIIGYINFDAADNANKPIFDQLKEPGGRVLKMFLLGNDGKVVRNAQFDITGGLAASPAAQQALAQVHTMADTYQRRCKHV